MANSAKLEAQETERTSADDKALVQKKTKTKTFAPKDGYSLIPVLAANSTYGLMLGGAVIFYKPLQHRHKFTFIVLGTKSRQTYALLDYDRQGTVWSQGIRFLVNNFFDAYYGESRAPWRGPPDQILTYTFKVKTYWEYRLSTDMGLQLQWDMRRRDERNKMILANGEQITRRIYPDERTSAFGLALIYDDRYEHHYSTLGTFASARILRMPGKDSTTLADQEPFNQWSLDLRYNHEVTSFLVLSERIYVGNSIGNPSYSFLYGLGGSNEMRGYGFSRFIGKKFYLGQIEARFPVYGIFSGSIFYEAGDITRDRFISTITDYGFGLKMSLPPDYVAKLRVDVGFGNEAPNFVMEADHAF